MIGSPPRVQTTSPASRTERVTDEVTSAFTQPAKNTQAGTQSVPTTESEVGSVDCQKGNEQHSRRELSASPCKPVTESSLTPRESMIMLIIVVAVVAFALCAAVTIACLVKKRRYGNNVK